MYKDILKFWFKEIEPAQWWKKDPAFDNHIRSRFLDIHTKAAQCELFSWRTSAPGALAEIIVLDQFSRNIYRDQAQSFAYDAIALTLAQSAIDKNYDNELNIDEKSFLYMPFMHSESLFIHEEATRIFDQQGLENTLRFELRHKEIIEKFGRYPHRNNILGRESTPEEIEFLKQPGSSF